MTRLLNAANKFLKVVREFGYPDCTLEVLAKDQFYQDVCKSCLRPEVPDTFIEEVLGFIKTKYGPPSD